MKQFLAAAFVWLLGAFPSIAQVQIETRIANDSLVVCVENEFGTAKLQGATVTVVPEATQKPRTLQTNEFGEAIFKGGFKPQDGTVAITAKFGSLEPATRTLDWTLREVGETGWVGVRVMGSGGREGKATVSRYVPECRPTVTASQSQIVTTTYYAPQPIYYPTYAEVYQIQTTCPSPCTTVYYPYTW